MMKLLGFGYSKYSAEKKSQNFKDLKLENSMNISEIEEVKSKVLNTKEAVLGIKWENEISYSPDIAKISFEGNMMVSLPEDKAKEILKLWKDKKIEPNFRTTILNLILRKTNVKALQMEEELNLPHHFRMPFLKPAEEKK